MSAAEEQQKKETQTKTKSTESTQYETKKTNNQTSGNQSEPKIDGGGKEKENNDNCIKPPPTPISKDKLVETIKEWVSLDDELKELQKATKERRDRKKEITSELVTVMKGHNIDCFDVGSGKLMYSRQQTKQSITKKFLLETLAKYYQAEYGDSEKATEVVTYMMENRQTQVKETIRRK